MDDILAHQGITPAKRDQILFHTAAIQHFSVDTPFHGVLIGVGGYKRHGKDTLAGYLAEVGGWARFGMSDFLHQFLLAQDPWVFVNKPVPYTPSSGYRLILAHGHYRYASLTALLGYEYAKDTVKDFRDLLRTTGDEGMRQTMFQDAWVRKAEERIRQHWAEGKPVAAVSIRYPNELALIKRLGGHTVWVSRTGYETPAETGDTHASENSVSWEQFDTRVDAETLAELRTAAAALDTIYRTSEGDFQ
jgi:hypothetical protein